MTAALRNRRIKPGLTMVHAANPPQVKCVIYLRLSDLREEDLAEDGTGKTFQARRDQLMAVAAMRGWDVIAVLVENDAFAKDGQQRSASAFKRKRVIIDGRIEYRVWRPVFRKILDMFRTGQANGILTEAVDRWTRDGHDGEDFIDIAERYGVWAQLGALPLTNGGTDFEISMYRNMLNMANLESRIKSTRQTAARRRKALKGEYGGGRRAFGFDRDPNTKRFVKRPDECNIIADCSRRVLQIDGRSRKRRWSLRALAAELRAQNVPTVTGAAWTPETLKDVLLRPLNANLSVYQGAIVEGVSMYDGKPVVPRHVYDAVVNVLTDPARQTGPGTGPKYLLTNLVRCGVCTPVGTEPTGRATMHVCATRGTYRCSVNCYLSIDREQLDAHVVSRVLALLSLPDAADLFLPARPDVDVDGLNTEGATLRLRLTELAEAFADGEIDKAQLATGTEKINSRLDAINAELMNSVADSPLMGLPQHGVDVVAWWQALPLANQRLVIDSIMTVTVLPYPDGMKRGWYEDRVIITPKNGDAAELTWEGTN